MATWTVGLGNTPTLYVGDGGTYMNALTVGNGGLTVSATPSGTDPIDGGNFHVGTNWGADPELRWADRGSRGLDAHPHRGRGPGGVDEGRAASSPMRRYLYQPLHRDARDYSGWNRHGTMFRGRHVARLPADLPDGRVADRGAGASPIHGGRGGGSHDRARGPARPGGPLDVLFLPYNGNKIPINGVNVTIPPGGVSLGARGSRTAWTTTSTLISTPGTSPSKPRRRAIAPTRRPGLRSRLGTQPARWSGWSGATAATPSTAGATGRGILSWYNRQPIGLVRAFTAARAITSVGTFVVVHSEIDLEFLTWADEAISLHWHGSVSNNTAGAATYSASGSTAPRTGASMLHNLPVVGTGTFPTPSPWVSTQPETGYYSRTSSPRSAHQHGDLPTLGRALTATIRG